MERKPQFSSIQEAFEALPEDLREHSLRVEKYADLIFMEVCASEEYIINLNSRVRLRYENRTMIDMAARYHDLGKILVPEVYHWNLPDFAPEEHALYLRHTRGGEELARALLENQVGVVPMLIETVCESLSAHHEHWDGSGTPKQTAGEDTPIVGRIVAVADRLDHLLMETRTETPVATAMDALMEESGSIYDPVILGLLYEAKHKIEKIFAQYRGASRAIPQAPHIIRRKTKRPMWLQYRPIMSLSEKKMVAVEADMRFRRGRNEVTFPEIEHLLRDNNRTWDAQTGFIIEACDMLRRMRNCELSAEYLVLHCVNGFWKKRGMGKTVASLLSDIDADPSAICFVLKGDAAANPTANVLENCESLREAGCRILYAEVPMESLKLETLLQTKPTHVALDAEGLENADKKESAKLIKGLTKAGIILLGAGLNRHRHFEVLEKAGIAYAYGDLIGERETENELIAGELALV